ncbi:L-fucose mutarotase [Blautia liquoris]|uniref:L-fucose mutarotase n=1 Tax=Blautia liquoris TaxID=2779518 RepID=A0A7M2RGR6_9FIRM|nr:RbsD/FucU domain-containing protein [Blautia liquoris]QOV18737.1 L-fucose mutarotase [Blautia liquoris]
MLKGIPEIIGSDLLKALADMGHGDILVVADHFYPPYSKSPNAVSVQAKGNTAPDMIDAILKLMPLDVEYCETPLEYMVPDESSGIIMENCDTWNEAIAAAVKNGYKEDCAGPLERSKFYKKAGKAVLTVCTSETRPYGCFILQKGVM